LAPLFVISEWLAVPGVFTTVMTVTAALAIGLGTLSLMRGVKPGYATALFVNVLIDGFFLWLVLSGRGL